MKSRIESSNGAHVNFDPCNFLIDEIEVFIEAKTKRTENLFVLLLSSS